MAWAQVMNNAMKTNSGTITTRSHALPMAGHAQALVDGVASLQAVLFIMIAFSFVPCGIVVFIVREKEVCCCPPPCAAPHTSPEALH